MTRPTKEQLEQARRYLARMAQASAFSRETADAIDTVLAATAEPTDEELAREVRTANVDDDGNLWDLGFARGYIAGARREGAR